MNSIRSTFVALGVSLFVSTTAVLPLAAAQSAPTQITWEACPADRVDIPAAECGSLSVPMYYSDPAGPRISVGFIRIPASSGVSEGTVFSNPGGPGGDAFALIGNSGVTLPAGLRESFDLVAVQPRGLTNSTPLDCTQMPAGWDPIRIQVEYGAFFKASCELTNPGYTNALTTENTARDWESVRTALGLGKINIYGISYGTELGSTYATLFPEHTNKVVLDSGYAPSITWNKLIGDQQEGYTQALHDYLSWVADNDTTYHLGTTPLQVYQAWSAKVVAESGTNPTVVPPPARIGDIPAGLQWAGQPAVDALTALGEPQAQIESLFSKITHPNAQQGTSVTLLLTKEALGGPLAWPRLAAMLAGQEPTPTPEELAAPNDNLKLAYASLSLLQIMTCNENATPADPRALPEYLWSSFVTLDPFVAGHAGYKAGVICSGTTPTTTRVPLDGSRLAHRPLQFQAVGDPQTPYDSFAEMAQSMGSTVITVEGLGHGQTITGNQAVNDIMMRYLRTGEATPATVPGTII